MASDPDAAAWALALVQLYSYPQVSLSKITLRPVAAEPFSSPPTVKSSPPD